MFGPRIPTSSLSCSVAYFFENGSSEAFVKRVKVNGAIFTMSSLKKGDSMNNKSFALTALSTGAAGNEIFVEIDPYGIGAKPFDATADKKRFNITITDRTTGCMERFGDLSPDTSATRFAVRSSRQGTRPVSESWRLARFTPSATVDLSHSSRRLRAETPRASIQ